MGLVCQYFDHSPWFYQLASEQVHLISFNEQVPKEGLPPL